MFTGDTHTYTQKQMLSMSAVFLTSALRELFALHVVSLFLAQTQLIECNAVLLQIGSGLIR